MSLADLKSPKKGAVCVACKAFTADCVAPVGEASAPMCWLCAHHVVDHDVPLTEAMEARCECTPDQIYPVRVLQERATNWTKAQSVFTQRNATGAFAHGDTARFGENTMHAYNPKTGEIERRVLSGRRGRC